MGGNIRAVELNHDLSVGCSREYRLPVSCYGDILIYVISPQIPGSVTMEMQMFVFFVDFMKWLMKRNVFPVCSPCLNGSELWTVSFSLHGLSRASIISNTWQYCCCCYFGLWACQIWVGFVPMICFVSLSAVVGLRTEENNEERLNVNIFSMNPLWKVCSVQGNWR